MGEFIISVCRMSSNCSSLCFVMRSSSTSIPWKFTGSSFVVAMFITLDPQHWSGLMLSLSTKWLYLTLLSLRLGTSLVADVMHLQWSSIRISPTPWRIVVSMASLQMIVALCHNQYPMILWDVDPNFYICTWSDSVTILRNVCYPRISKEDFAYWSYDCRVK